MKYISIKNLLPLLLVAIMIGFVPNKTFAQDPPRWVKDCLNRAYEDFVTNEPKREVIKEYVDPQAVLEAMRNLTSYSDPEGVIDSVFDFAKFVHRQSKKRSGEEIRVTYTFYKEGVRSVIVRAQVGDPDVPRSSTRVKLILQMGKCSALDFVAEGVKGMRDKIPKI